MVVVEHFYSFTFTFTLKTAKSQDTADDNVLLGHGYHTSWGGDRWVGL